MLGRGTPDQPQLVRVSRTIARQVMKENVAILGVDVPATGKLREVESLVASEVRTLLCVPLTVFQRAIGCIYLDSTNAADRFQEDHLQLLTAIAGVSAVALDNARRLQWLEQENQRLTTEVRQEQSLVGEGARIKEIYQFLAQGRADRIDGADRGRKWDGQGAGGAGVASQQPPGEQAIRGDQLRGDPRVFAGERSVWA